MNQKNVFFVVLFLTLFSSHHVCTQHTLGPYVLTGDHPIRKVSQVYLYGFKENCHTHSYIYYGFKKAFEALGYPAYWVDKHDNLNNYPLANSLFITDGQSDDGIPLRDDCYYIIHNSDRTLYKNFLENGHCIILQVYTHDCLKRNEPSFAPCMHYNLAQSIIYMPWATDLLPHEINKNKEILLHLKKISRGIFIGTATSPSASKKTPFDNANELYAFKAACQEAGIPFTIHQACSIKTVDAILLTQQSILAPAIQGAWQCQQGYIPCRIFKNISYGAMGVTNSLAVYELFDRKVIYNADCYQLGKQAIEALKTWTLEDQHELMDYIRDHHTYLNRIEMLFNYFELVDLHKKGLLHE